MRENVKVATFYCDRCGFLNLAPMGALHAVCVKCGYYEKPILFQPSTSTWERYEWLSYPILIAALLGVAWLIQ